MTEHDNIDTAETPVYEHGTESHVVHGVRLHINLATDETGAEVYDGAVAIFVDGRELSLKEARDLSRALFSGVDRVTFDWIMEFELASHEKHERLREGRNDPARTRPGRRSGVSSVAGAA